MYGLIGEIRLFAGNFAPRDWAFCDGQLLEIQNNTALFSILGTIYGGDGRVTFALPNLKGKVAMGDGVGPGLSSRRLGQRGGIEQVRLTATEMPSHTHNLQGYNNGGGTNNPTSAFPAEGSDDIYKEDVNVSMGATNSAGGNEGHENRQPFLVTNYIICTYGEYPSRS